jgi:hypothetical protein
VTWSCEHGVEPLGSRKGDTFLDWRKEARPHQAIPDEHLYVILRVCAVWRDC